MAVYTTIDDLEKRLDSEVLAGLADDVNTPPDLDSSETREVINRAIEDGGSLIDSYLLGRVNLADPVIELTLERINATLALYFLYRRRYLDDLQNPMAAAREAVTAYMMAVASGRERIGLADGVEPRMTVRSTTLDYRRLFDRTRLRGF